MDREPALRFPEFDGTALEYRIEEILERVVHPVKVSETNEYYQIGIRSHGKGIFHKKSVTGKELGNKRVFWIKPELFVVNIVFAWEQAVSKTTKNEIGMIASHRFPMYRPYVEKADLDYLLYLFLTKWGKHLLGLASPGGAGRNKTLGQNEFNRLKIFIPEVQEQQKIAQFLTIVDTKIEQLTKKKILLEQYKNGVSQKLFSQEIRFKADDGSGYSDWVEKKLGDVTTDVMYGIGSSAIKFDGINKYIRITDIDDTNKFLPSPLSSPDGVIEDKYKLKSGDIVFARTGASVGKSYLYQPEDGNLIFAGFLIKFHIPNDIPYFIFSQTHSTYYKNWVKVMSVRSGQPGLNAEEYKLLKLLFPSLPEQQKIANFLSSIDTKIEQTTKQLDQTKQFKKALLQQMFV